MKTIKLLACAALAAACMAGFTGCSKKDYSKPKVAEGTVLALAVRSPEQTSLAPLVEKYKLNDNTAALKSMPKEMKEFFEKLELDKVETKWALVTIGGEIDKDKVAAGKIPDIACVFATTLDLDKVVTEFENTAKGSDKPEFKKTTIAGVSAYEITSKGGDKIVPCAASLDGKLIICASSAAVLEKQIALYRDGKGESSDFSSFAVAGNDILRVKAVKVGEIVQKVLPDPSLLKGANEVMEGGDKIVQGLASVEIGLSASDDGKDIKLDVTVETASDADAEKLITAAKGGLAMATAAAQQGAAKDEEAKAALGVLESAKAVNEGKAAKLTAAAPAEPLLQFVSKMIK